MVLDPRFECEEIFERLGLVFSGDAGHPLPAAGADAGGKNALSLQVFRPCGKYAAEYDLDPLLVYSFVRTESGFDPDATSSVEARGLMQMTEETFLWLRSKIAEGENVTFGDLYDPAVSLRFGCYYLHLCMERYGGDVATAAAAYHSGWGTVDALLQKEEHSADGITLQGFPYNQMHHYVEKITACYAVYQNLYGT